MLIYLFIDCESTIKNVCVRLIAHWMVVSRQFQL